MKFKKLLVLSMLSLFGTSAWADVPESTWTMPEPQGLEFTTFTDDGTHYYLYNPAAKMFFASGNSWNTQASVRTFGYPFWVDISTEEDAPEGSYELWDDFNNADRTDVSGAHNLFTDDGGSTWVDHASQGNYSWTFTIVGDYVRFQNVALIADKPEYEGKYIGWVGTYEGDKNSSVLKMILPDVEGTSVDWKAVTEDSYLAFTQDEEAYKAYTDGVDCFFAAQKLHGALVQADGLKANIAAGLAVFTNLSSTAAELTAATDALKPIIEARTALKKALDDAATAGFTDVAEYQAVFDNGDATKAEIEKATTDLGNAVVEWGKTNASVEHPVDMTSKIKNPNFDNASYTGWLGTEPNMVGSGSHGPANVAEKWNATFDTYQDITELPAGVYALGAKTSWRGNWSDMENGVGPAAKLYVTIGENEYSTPFNYIWACYNTEPLGGTTDFGTSAGENSEEHENEAGESVTYYSPNDPSAFRVYEEKGFYDTKVLFGLSEGSIRIGVKNPSLMGGADNWSCFDTFTLTFYGAGADAAQLYLDESLKNFSEVTIPEETVYTESYLTAYQAAYTGEKTADSFDAAAAIVNGISDAKKALDKNIELWKTYQKTCEDSFEKYCKDDASYNPDICLTVGDLADYVDGNVKYVGDEELDGYETTLNEHKLNNEELQAEIDYVNGLCEQIDKEAKEGLKEGDDVTRFLKNADFEMCDVKTQTGEAPYWTVKKDVGNVTAGPLGQDNYNTMVNALGKMNYCFESWHSHDFDVYQEVNNVPEGVYVIEAQGYVRCENNGYSRPDEVADADIPIHLYLNNATDVFPSVYSELAADLGHEYTTVESWTTEDINGNLYPNSMGGAAQCFEWGMYKMQTYGLVKEGETMRIGVKGKMKTDDTENWWCIWDNFKLTFQGYNVEYVQPALDKAMANIDITKPMGKNVYDTAKGLADKAAEAKATGDGKTMFQMLADVYDASAAIISSVQLFATLTDAIENETTGLQAAIYTSANDKAKAEAEALVGTITSGMENHDINDDEVAGLLEQIANMKTKLAMPADWESATDDNSADFTGVIVNPAYDEGVSGWSGTGAAWSDSGLNAEIFGKDYDYYQDIIGLPAGTYEVTVQGFYRAGDASTDYNTWIETPDENNNAYLYAAYINGTDTVVSSVPLKRLAAEAESEADGAYLEDGYVYAKNPSEEGAGDGWIVPNNMTTASYEFDKEKYNNKVIVKLGSDDATLRIGLKKEVNLDNNWSIWDNWHINYFGKASSKEADGDAATAISTMEAAVAPVKVEFFTIDGRKAIRAQKGVILQKTTLSNGATIIKKIMK